MLDAGLFDKLDFVACEIRKNRQPFGGLPRIENGSSQGQNRIENGSS